MSVGELKLELSNLLLDLIGFDGDAYTPLINKAKTVEELDKVVDFIIQQQNNAQFEKQLVIFWKKNR